MRARTLAALPLVLLSPVHRPRPRRPLGRRRRPAGAAARRRGADTASAGLVFDEVETRYRFRKDGTGTITRHVRFVPTSEAGVAGITQIPFPYVAGAERFTLVRLRVVEPGGRVVTGGPDAVHDGTSPVAQDAPVFTDIHLAHVVIPDLSVGDTVDIETRTDILRPEAPGRYWVAEPFPDIFPVRREAVVVSVPAAAAAHVWTAAGPPPRVTHPEPGRAVYTWVRSSAGRSLASASMQRLFARESAPAVELSSFASWSSLAAWYGAMEDSAARPTPGVRARAAALTRGLTDTSARVRALYDFVSRRIRYVSLSLGRGAYRPHPADSVLAVGYGDCKDQAALLGALLASVGIPSHPALVNATSAGAVHPGVPSPAAFDHVVTVVPMGKDTLWLDPTSGVAPPGFLPADVRGARVLLVDGPGGGRLVTAPVGAPYANLATVSVRGRVTPGGTLVATYDEHFQGDLAVALRAVLSRVDSSELDRVFTTSMASMGVGGTASRARVTGLDSTRSPVAVHFQDSASSYVPLDSARRAMRLPVSSLAGNAASDTSGADSVVDLGGPSTQTERVTLAFPRGVAPRAPPGVHLERSWGSYRSSYRVQDRTLVAERVMRLDRASLPRDSLPAVRAFLAAVSSENTRPVQLHVRLARLPLPRSKADAEALAVRAWNDIHAGRTARGAREARQAVAADSGLADGWLDLSVAFIQEKKWSEAERAARRVIRLSPYQKFAYNNLGLILQRRGELPAAERAYRRELQLHPLELKANVNLAGALDARGQLDSAIAQARHVVSIAPDSAFSHRLLARAYLQADSAAAAVPELRKANRLDPSDEWTSHELTLTLSRMGRGKQARGLMEHSTDAASANPMRRVLAAVGLAQTGASDSAVALVRRGLAAHPKSGMWHFAVAWVLTYVGRYSKALPDARAAVLLDGKKAQEWMLLGRLESFDNDPKDALHAYRKSLAIDSTVLKRSRTDLEIYHDLTGPGS